MLSQFHTHLVSRRRSPATIRVRMVYLRLLSERHQLDAVTATDLEEILASKEHWKPETVNSAIATWNVFYKWALRLGHVSVNPAEDLERAYVPRVVKALADDSRIQDALRDADPIDRGILLLGREAGLRRAEIATLRIEHRHGDWLHVTGKGGRWRRIHLTPGLRDALDALTYGPAGYYFPGHQDGHLAVEAVARRVRKLIGTSTHSLRRGALTAVYRNSGGNIRMAQEFAGHARVDTTAIYIQINENDLMEAGGHAALAA